MLGPLQIATAVAAAPAAVPVSGRRWQARVLVVFAPGASAELTAQRAAVHSRITGFAERDVLVVEVVGDDVHGSSDTARALRQRFGVANGAFRVLLVGLDGGVKLTRGAPLAADTIFAAIDAMPMRRVEMAR